ncbi:MAG: NHLP leader peptide family RiPP precursor [Microscillaceae bacterium]|nr:NHLP leader peptide family RiPP precursor [Microscillaceae bacterium]MDW8461108.1 NHLP leader peptide family RiPP precursor [Cytophagales bacterium]
MKQQVLLEKVAALAQLSSDVQFRNEFMANPKTVLQNLFPELKLPEDTRIILHENTSDEMHVILLPSEEAVFNASLDDKVEQVLDKAILDQAFKKLLLADPKGVLQRELPDFFVPDNFKIYFHENTDKEIHLLIPNLAPQGDELSEEELGVVAGGAGRGPHIGRPRGGKPPKCRSQHFRRG